MAAMTKLRVLGLAGLLAASAMAVPSAWAQRTDDNAVSSADDAFGSSIGDEEVGIYSPYRARGFSPVDAGNVRIDGLYFDLQAPLSARLVSGWTMRVGISAQGFPFVAPTGIADYTLRRAGREPLLSVLAGYGPFGSGNLELDGQLPLDDSLSIAVGASYAQEGQYIGGFSDVTSAAIIPRWQPTKRIEILPFWSTTKIANQEAQPFIFTSGPFLPPRIETERYNEPNWAQNSLTETNFGAVSTIDLDDWTLRLGLFRSIARDDESYAPLALNTDANGLADRFVLAQVNQEFGSVSGEARLSRTLRQNTRQHALHISLRGREQERRYGGGQLVALGRRPIDEPVTDVARPDSNYGPRTLDRVSQYTLGLGYQLKWLEVGEFALGVQKADYEKNVNTPTEALPRSADRPWLYNASLSLLLTDDLVAYGSFARGLEESPIAPEVAANRDSAPPAILTEQIDAGVRYNLTDQLRLIVGGFEVTKPYFAVDSALLFQELGEVRHRGIEFSLAGSLTPQLYVLAGTYWLDAKVTGQAVAQGLVGPKPIGSIERTSVLYAQYTFETAPGLSLDLTYESTGDRVADTLNRFVVPPRSVTSLGVRYRRKIADTPATLRAQWGNVFDRYGYSVLGEGFYYNGPRRFSVTLALDF